MKASLINKAGVSGVLELAPSTESAWIEVIQKMDSVYADLVHYQVELEQKNSALEEAQQFIHGVLSAMTDVLIVCDTDGRILQINKALENLTGKPAVSFLQGPVSQFFTGDSRDKLEVFAEQLRQGTLVDCEISILCADGAAVPLAVNGSSRYDHEGALVGMVLIGRPIGELRQAYDDLNSTLVKLRQTQQQLVHSEKIASLGRLVAGVAHELNNPISFVFGNMYALKRYGARITGYLQAMESLAVDSRQLRQLREKYRIEQMMGDIGPLIEGTLEGAERVSDIVQDLRRYSGNQREVVTSFDLPAALKKAVQWVVKACRVKPIVRYELPNRLEITTQKGHIHQILVNLLQNTVDAMADLTQPQLTLHCSTTAEGIIIQLHDQGPGIAKQDLGHIFDPFFTSKPVGKGTGLGLYISYGLARDLGGDLCAQNHPLGGALFTLSLPATMVKPMRDSQGGPVSYPDADS